MSNPEIACSPGALAADENMRRERLLDLLFEAVEAIRELPDGYEFRYRPDPAIWPAVAEWVDLERRCCPFFTFGAQIVAGDDAVRLSITGAVGVKEYLRSHIPAC